MKPCKLCGFPLIGVKAIGGRCRETRACQKRIAERLEHLRGCLRRQSISWGELHELQCLAKYIQCGDVELLEAAGVPEFPATKD